MTIPRSILQAGFQPMQQARRKVKLSNGKMLKPVMIGTEGVSDSGKSEFILSCPGPGIINAIDRQLDPLFDNPNPPASRRDDFAVEYMEVPLQTQGRQTDYIEYYRKCKDRIYAGLSIPEALTVAIDGDSDLWDLQVLAEFGKKTQIWPQTRWGDVYAARRAFTARLHDSGKIIIGTNKLRDEFELVIDPKTGLAEKEADGSDKRRRTGNLERAGYKDQDYLWNIQIRHLYQPPRINKLNGKVIPASWGLRILKCKPNTELVGEELWGSECNFLGLITLVYPNTDPSEFGL